MKLRNLLVSGALLLAGTASAAIVDGVRQAPAFPKGTDVQFGAEMYLMNAQSGKFFLGANSWETQASYGDQGWKVKVSQYLNDAGEWDNKTVTIEDSVQNGSHKGKWLKAWFVSDGDANTMYTDHNGQADYLWNLQKVGDYYRLSASALNPTATVNTYEAAGYFVGVNLAADTRLYSNLVAGDENHLLDWSFITPADYTAYQEAFGVYQVAQSLKALIDDAKGQGLDVAAQEAVYAEEASTTEELEAAIAVVKDALAKAEELTVDPMNPVDKTSAITNPSYDGDSKSGWSGTSIHGCSYACAEQYNKTFDTWTMVEGLPNGLYKMTVQGFYRPATAGSTGAVFYAVGADSVTVTAPDHSSAVGLDSKPGNMQTASEAFAAGYYGMEVYFVVTENKARLGVALPELTGGSDWVIWDNWQLTYYGNKGEATYAGAVKGLVEANIAKFDGREAEMTVGLLDATYKPTLNGLTATDLESLNGAIATIEEATAAVQTNIDGWVKYNEEILRGTTTANDKSFSESTQMSTMAVYVRRQAPSILNAKKLSTEELLAEVAKLTQMIEDAIRNSLQVNSDVTDMFLVNARYEDGTTGWNGSWTAVNYGCMEAYERDWDAYQIVKDAPQGVYEVSLQGFYRVARGTEAYTKYQNGQQICPGHVYVNNHLSEVKCVFDEPVKAGDGYIFEAIGTGPESNPNAFVGEDGDSIFFPNDMKTAGEAFAAGMYVSSANGLVAQKGDELRIGVKGKKQTATWVIWDNFKMIFRGKLIAYTLPYLQDAVAAAETTLTQAMDKDTKELLQTAKANAEALLSSTDEDAVFEALVQIYAAQDSVAASADLFAELKTKADELQNAIMQYEATATGDAMNAATALLVQMMEGLEGSSTKEEVQTMIAQVGTVIINLIIGDPSVASDDNVMDFTQLLSCPSFEDVNGNGSAEGWTGADGGATGSGAYEFFQKTFDLNQTLTNIPNGTYRIEVSAYERIGAATNDYTLYKEGKDTATTYIYGVVGDATYEKAVSRLASAPIFSNDASGIEGCIKVDSLQNVELGEDSLYWVANTMASGVVMFTDYIEYQNSLYAEVTDGTLTIGIKKEAQASNDWVLMDNWKLYYHGTDSKFKPSSIENVVLGNGAAVVKREIFTLGGAKVNRMEQGVYILRNIHADGTVTVKKVIK